MTCTNLISHIEVISNERYLPSSDQSGSHKYLRRKMEQPSSTSNGETSFVEVSVVDKATSRDPEADDADTKMASANNSIAEDMSISTLSVELGESETKPPPNNVDATTSADQQQEETSVPAAAAVDETSARQIDGPAADPSPNDHEDKVEASDKKALSNSEQAKSLPTFPALPSGGPVSDTRQEPQNSASSPTKSSADDVATSTSTGQQQKLETPPSPSIAIAKRPKPGGVASSSKLRAASMPNNPNRGDDRSNSTTTSTAAPAANVTPLRRGKWTKEEEEYAAMVIQMFNAGYLPAPAGT